MITNETAWLAARGFPSRFDGVTNNRRLGRALVGLLRLADYARSLTRSLVEESGHLTLAGREAREWKQLYTRATERAEQQHREHQLALDRHGSERFKAGASRGHEAAVVEIRELLENGQPEGLDISDVLVLMLERGPADGD